MKKKDTKKTEKPKKSEGPNRKKTPAKKRIPSKVIKSTKQRTETRRRAVERAAAQLRRFAIPFELGDSIIIATRHKVMIAFDHPEDSIPGLRAHAEATGTRFVHIDADYFSLPTLFDAMVVDAINAKPIYAGSKKGIVPPVKIPDIIKQGGPKPHLSVTKDKSGKSSRAKKVEKISTRRLTPSR